MMNAKLQPMHNYLRITKMTKPQVSNEVRKAGIKQRLMSLTAETRIAVLLAMKERKAELQAQTEINNNPRLSNKRKTNQPKT
jgi:fructose-1-phosphate kinase PfkB-like protein